MEHIIAKLLHDFEQGRMTRRQLVQGLTLVATVASAASAPAAAADGKVVRAININHVSYQVADYARTRDFYADLFGMKVSADDGKQCRLSVGESLIVARTRPSGTPRVDHIAYTIAGWDEDKNVKFEVAAELKRRGLKVEMHAQGGAVVQDTALARGFHFHDPDGFELQVGGKDQ